MTYPVDSSTQQHLKGIEKRLEMFANTYVGGMFAGDLTLEAIENWKKTSELANWCFAKRTARCEEEFHAELQEGQAVIDAQVRLFKLKYNKANKGCP